MEEWRVSGVIGGPFKPSFGLSGVVRNGCKFIAPFRRFARQTIGVQFTFGERT